MPLIVFVTGNISMTIGCQSPTKEIGLSLYGIIARMVVTGRLTDYKSYLADYCLAI